VFHAQKWLNGQTDDDPRLAQLSSLRFCWFDGSIQADLLVICKSTERWRFKGRRYVRVDIAY